MTRFLTTICISLLTFSVASAQADADPLTANQWVQPTVAGTLTGRIILPSRDGMSRAVQGASVNIISVDGGGVNGQAITDGMGEFTISGVAPGVYSITSRAANAYAHLAIQVIDSSVDLGGRYPSIAEISASNMGYEAVFSMISPYRPPSNNRVISMANADLNALANQVINGETYRVAQSDGGISGRLYAAGADGPNLIPAPMTNVFMMRNGVEVGREVTNESGEFRIDGLPVGNYSMLAIGRDGLAVIGFELVGEGGGVAKRSADGKQLVSAVEPTDFFGCQLWPFVDEYVDDVPLDGIVLDVPLDCFEGCFEGCGGGCDQGGAYYGGGGGGGGGVGGFGSIAGLAGLAGLAGAFSSDDGDRKDKPPTASDYLPETGSGGGGGGIGN